ncbi:MAG TPA: GcrA family cell cycle regulator [Aestuariivirgaceae bacterium]
MTTTAQDANSPTTPNDKLSWTEERVELLKKYWNEGLSASQIASRLGYGVTRNAVIGKVHRLGLSGRVTPQRAARPRPRRTREPTHPGRPMLPVNGATALKPLHRAEPQLRLEPEPEPIRLVDIPQGERVNILMLSERTCRWPVGDPGSSDFCFCGHTPKASGGPYCEYHSRIAFQPLQDRRRHKVAS